MTLYATVAGSFQSHLIGIIPQVLGPIHNPVYTVIVLGALEIPFLAANLFPWQPHSGLRNPILDPNPLPGKPLIPCRSW